MLLQCSCSAAARRRRTAAEHEVRAVAGLRPGRGPFLEGAAGRLYQEQARYPGAAEADGGTAAWGRSGARGGHSMFCCVPFVRLRRYESIRPGRTSLPSSPAEELCSARHRWPLVPSMPKIFLVKGASHLPRQAFPTLSCASERPFLIH